MITITRNTEIKKLEKAKKWKLVCGRRKTGKSFLIEYFTKWDKYFFVKRGGEIYDKTAKRGLTYQEFIILLDELLQSDKQIVVDEFHRLPNDFLDFLHINSGKGNLTVISSTLWLSKRLLEKDSPILGLFSEIIVHLIDERDILIGLKKYPPKDAVLLSTYMKEPLMLRYLNKSEAMDILVDYFTGTKFLVPLLISSVFREEDKAFTQIYEGIVRAVASGKRSSKEITDFLYSRRLIPKADHGYCQQYIHNLNMLGIISKIRIFNSRKVYYLNSSPMIDAYFYMDEKYNFSENDIEPSQIKNIIWEIAPLHIENFICNLLTKIYGLTQSKIISPKLELDIALCKFKKLAVVGEVKWRKKLSEGEIRKIEDKLSGFKCRKVLVVPDKSTLTREPEGIEVLTARDLVKLANK